MARKSLIKNKLNDPLLFFSLGGLIISFCLIPRSIKVGVGLTIFFSFFVILSFVNMERQAKQDLKKLREYK